MVAGGTPEPGLEVDSGSLGVSDSSGWDPSAELIPAAFAAYMNYGHAHGEPCKSLNV